MRRALLRTAWRHRRTAFIATAIPATYVFGRFAGVRDGLSLANYSRSRNRRLKAIKREQIKQRRFQQQKIKQKT